MTCANAMILAPHRMLIGSDSQEAIADRRGGTVAGGIVEKAHQLSAPPIFITGRGSRGFLAGVEGSLRRSPRKLDWEPDRFAAWLTKWYRRMAWLTRMPRDLDAINLVICGWNGETMTLTEYIQGSRAAGFRVEPKWPWFVAPDVPGSASLTEPRSIGAMFDLLGEQVRYHRRNGKADFAGPPLIVFELTPGHVERFERATLDAEPSAAEVAADERIWRERKPTATGGLGGAFTLHATLAGRRG